MESIREGHSILAALTRKCGGTARGSQRPGRKAALGPAQQGMLFWWNYSQTGDRVRMAPLCSGSINQVEVGAVEVGAVEVHLLTEEAHSGCGKESTLT